MEDQDTLVDFWCSIHLAVLGGRIYQHVRHRLGGTMSQGCSECLLTGDIL